MRPIGIGSIHDQAITLYEDKIDRAVLALL